MLAGREDRLDIAAVNGPCSVVISGDHDAVHAAAAVWRERGRKARLLKVSHAFHSPHMDGILDELRAVASELTFSAPAIPLVSNATGRLATASQLASPDYWARHARHAVRFMDGVHTLLDVGVTTFLELGPDAPLTAMTRECLSARPGPASGRPRPAAVAALRRDRPEARTFATAMAQAYVRGAEVAWDRACAGQPRQRIALPTYAFQRDRYWPGTALESTAPATHTTGTDGATDSAPPTAETAEPAAAAWHRDPLDTVRTHVALVLGHSEPGAIDAGLTFKELGFDSLAATELSERLGAATGLPLTATLTFDHPTPLAVADHLRAHTTPATGPSTASTAITPRDAGEPIAVVAMGCRFPGGVDSPEALWRLVAEGADAIGEFPRDRGWDLAGLFNPDQDRPGTSYAHEGGFLYDAPEIDADSWASPPRGAGHRPPAAAAAGNRGGRPLNGRASAPPPSGPARPGCSSA
ncbi:Polyketide synthase OS=Streptomyces antimycoticus OX=68175 GN=SANT12839_087120 PE=4 SV=1 [Streptomyces antimycoticus]